MSKFDWIQFHKDLDGALNRVIVDTKILPTKMTLLEFMEFVNSKRVAQQSETN